MPRGFGGLGQLVHALHHHLGGVPDAKVGQAGLLAHCDLMSKIVGVGKMLIDKNYGILTQVLRYEAASTIYGPHTLLAYQQQYARITKVAISKSSSQSLFKAKTFRRFLKERS